MNTLIYVFFAVSMYTLSGCNDTGADAVDADAQVVKIIVIGDPPDRLTLTCGSVAFTAKVKVDHVTGVAAMLEVPRSVFAHSPEIKIAYDLKVFTTVFEKDGGAVVLVMLKSNPFDVQYSQVDKVPKLY